MTWCPAEALIRLKPAEAKLLIECGNDRTPINAAVLNLSPAIIKFRPTSVCELLGYQLAKAIGFDRPRVSGFWVSDDTSDIPAMRVGVGIEWIADATDASLEQAARDAPDTAARILALGLLTRDEVPEILRTPTGFLPVDLEFLFPMVIPEQLHTVTDEEREASFRRVEFAFESQSREVADQVRARAHGLSLSRQVDEKVSEIADWLTDTGLSLPGFPFGPWLPRRLSRAGLVRLRAYSRL